VASKALCVDGEEGKCFSGQLFFEKPAAGEFLYIDDLAYTCLYLINHYDAEAFVNEGAGLGCKYQGVCGDDPKLDRMPKKLIEVAPLHGLVRATRSN